MNALPMPGCARSSRRPDQNESGTGSSDFRRLSRPHGGRARDLENSSLHGRSGAVGRCSGHVRLYQPIYKQSKQGESPLLEIPLATNWPLPEACAAGRGLVHSGVTSEFLMATYAGGGPLSETGDGMSSGSATARAPASENSPTSITWLRCELSFRNLHPPGTGNLY